MAITSVNLPAHLYAHTEVAIHDNTIRTYARAANTNCKVLAVFMSPKGRDRKMTTIEGGIKEFDEVFGAGSFAEYGQPLVNARASANTNIVTLQCLRLTADDATYANNVVWVQWKTKQEVQTPVQGKVVVYNTDTTSDDYGLITRDGSGNPVYQVVMVQDTNPDNSPKFNENDEPVMVTHMVQETDPITGVGLVNADGTPKMVPDYVIGDVLVVNGDRVVMDANNRPVKEMEVTPGNEAKLIVRFVAKPVRDVTDQEAFYSYFDTACKHALEGTLTSEDGAPNLPRRLVDETVEDDLTTDINEKYVDSNYISTTDGQGNVTYAQDTDFQQAPFMAFISTGRGTYGNAMSVRLSNNPRADKSNRYKNYYLRVFGEGQETIDGPVRVTLTENAIVNGKSLEMSEVVNGIADDGSRNIRMKVNHELLGILRDLYVTDVAPSRAYDLTSDAFDPILGIDKTLATVKSSEYKDWKDVVNSASLLSGFEIRDDGEETWVTTASGRKVISSWSTQFNRMLGIELMGGSDGAFSLSTDPLTRIKAIRTAYWNAFEGNIDPDIKSKTKFPLDAIFDADFPNGRTLTTAERTSEALKARVDEKSTKMLYAEAESKARRELGISDDAELTPAERENLDVAMRKYLTASADVTNYVTGGIPVWSLSIKSALADLLEARHEDCFGFFDLGTDVNQLATSESDKINFTVKEEAAEYPAASELDDTINWWNMSIDAYYGKIRDPYNLKLITVTSTYNLSINYPLHWKAYGGKHIPYAGSKYGIIDNYIKNTVFPVFDVDLDEKWLDKLTDNRINYAQIDAKGNIIRGAQNTRWPVIGDALTVSNLSETNNALIILDIKKDAIRMVSNYAYNFNEASDLALFNRDADQLVQKYKDAQVRSITATFTRTEEEAELGILHLYIAVVHKALVKINLIDIDVNRAVSTTE